MPGSEKGLRATAIILFAALLLVYAMNFRFLGAGDSIPTRLLPFSILREGNLSLDEFDWPRSPAGRIPYYVRHEGGHFYSTSTIATPLVITPLYIMPALWLSAYDLSYDDVRARVLIVVMERVSAACLTALSASLLFLVLARLVARRWAVALALLYALGTSTWAISSQALWSHALSELALVVLCALFLQREPSRAALVLAGVTASVAVANRPQMVGFAVLALAFVWVHHRRHVLAFAAVPLVGAAALIAHNLAVFSGLAGGYAIDLAQFSTPLLEGLAGLLVSPNRGLFIFTPVMVFAAPGAARVWGPSVHPWLRFLVVGLGLHLCLHAKFDEWWAGYAFGPRYMTDVLPVLTLLLVYGLVPVCRGRAMKIVAAVLALWGVGVQAIGVYCTDDGWNREPVPLELSPERVWDWTDLQILRALRNGWRGTELLPVMLDALRSPIPIRLVELSAGDLASELAVLDVPARMPHGAGAAAVVRVRNRGTRGWPAFSGRGKISVQYLTYLVVRWFTGGRSVAGVGDVLPLPRNLAPGQAVQMPLPLIAPPVPGSYEVEIRVSQALDGRRGIVGADALRFPVTVE